MVDNCNHVMRNVHCAISRYYFTAKLNVVAGHKGRLFVLHSTRYVHFFI